MSPPFDSKCSARGIGHYYRSHIIWLHLITPNQLPIFPLILYIDVGDCHQDTDCTEGLVCGYGNCAPELGYDPDVDCCYRPQLGDQRFCSWKNLCAHEEGDCNHHGDCQPGLLCGENNCPSTLGFDADVDCCFDVTIKKWVKKKSSKKAVSGQAYAKAGGAPASETDDSGLPES